MSAYSGIGKSGLLDLYMDYTRTDEWRAQHYDKIAKIAYYKAQARNFKAGMETQDWLEAEHEIARRLVPHEFFV